MKYTTASATKMLRGFCSGTLEIEGPVLPTKDLLFA